MNERMFLVPYHTVSETGNLQEPSGRRWRCGARGLWRATCHRSRPSDRSCSELSCDSLVSSQRCVRDPLHQL